MNKRNFAIVLLIVLWALPVSILAADFDGSKPFVSAITDAYECDGNTQCQRVSVEEIDCPRFLKVDLSKKMITGTLSDQSTRDVEIQSSARVDGNLILQGVQKGRAWGMVISESTGKMTLTVSGQEEGFVFFGASFLK